MSDTYGGTHWHKVEFVSATDGDTVRVRRWRIIKQETSNEGDGQLCRETREEGDDPEIYPKGIPHRLVNLDTPEKGDPGYKEAGADLRNWFAANEGFVSVITYLPNSGGFDRVLGDFYGRDGMSLSEYMLRRGWAPYVRGM